MAPREVFIIIERRGDSSRYEVLLETSTSVDDIEMVMCFIVEPEQLEIVAAGGPAAGVSDAAARSDAAQSDVGASGKAAEKTPQQGEATAKAQENKPQEKQSPEKSPEPPAKVESSKNPLKSQFETELRGTFDSFRAMIIPHR